MPSKTKFNRIMEKADTISKYRIVAFRCKIKKDIFLNSKITIE